MLSYINCVIYLLSLSVLATRVQNYLQETLGLPPTQYAPWPHQESLPYFLRDAFDFRQLHLLGQTVLLVLQRHPEKPSVADIRVRLDKVRSVTGQPAVYVTESLASYERKRLIQQQVPFIVPGNQLYLPDLGIDLREYFRRRRGSSDAALSPSAQALLIAALLRPDWEPEWHPAETVALLGYTSMTLSRGVRELTAAGLATAHKSGRAQYLRMAYPPRETWKRAAPLLRNPVQRTVWTSSLIRPSLPIRVAGLSALARLSVLAETGLAVYAVSRTAWQALHLNPAELPEALPDACEWQLWNYTPTLNPGSDTVDPLSLILSLRDSIDERIQSALDALQAHLPW